MRTFALSVVFIIMAAVFFTVLSAVVVLLFPITWKELTNAPAWCVIALLASIFVSAFSVGELDEKLV